MRTRPDWNSILAVAKDADSRLGNCCRQGRRIRSVYWSSFRRACALGYRGTPRDWRTFVEVQGSDRLL